MHSITNATDTTTFASSTTTISIALSTTSIATTCKVKRIKMKISRGI